MCDKHTPMAEGTACEHCGECLKEEERTHPITPEGAGGPVCERCYREEYRDICERCQEWTDKEDLSAKPGEILAIWEKAPASPEDLKPGYYRVKAWPFHVDYMLGGYYYSDKLKRVADLDAQGQDAAKDATFCGSPLCGNCRQQVEAYIAAK